MPHCSAASSRKAFCSGESWSPSAMPSTVPTSEPSTSAAITRQALTIRPSSFTQQAPQLPLLQPFLGAGHSDPVAQRLEQAVALVGEKDRGLPIDGGVDDDVGRLRARSGSQWRLPTKSCVECLRRALGGLADGSFGQHAGEVPALADRAAHVGDRDSGGTRGGRCGFDRLVAERLADERGGGVGDEQRDRARPRRSRRGPS